MGVEYNAQNIARCDSAHQFISLPFGCHDRRELEGTAKRLAMTARACSG
jgi:hypothetical protein